MAAAAGFATIVVVESDPAAQELVEQALRARGHRVLVTGEPLEALNLGRRVRIDVFVEAAEPSVDRPSVAAQLRSMQPELRVIRVSDQDGRWPTPDPARTVSLRRPLSLDELTRAIEEVVVPAGR